MQQILSSTSKILVDTKSSGNLLYLPLDKLMQQSGATGAPSEAQAAQRATPEPVQPADAGPRSRETLRERERGAR